MVFMFLNGKGMLVVVYMDRALYTYFFQQITQHMFVYT